MKRKRYSLESLLDKHHADGFDIVHIYHLGARQATFLFLRLLSQDVALVSMFSLDLPRSGKGEPFFGTGISFNFWHFSFV